MNPERYEESGRSLLYLNLKGLLPYCKGCGHILIAQALERALQRLQISPKDIAIFSDIGCVGLIDERVETPHTVHTTHGRSTAFATGLAITDGILSAGKMKSIVMIGDGGAIIGLLHLVQAALMNVDLTVLVHNNFLYGMTGGQSSGFTPQDFVTVTTPAGNFVPPVDLCKILEASHGGFIARKISTDKDLPDVVAKAIAYPGFAVVEILELCVAYAVKNNPITGKDLEEIGKRQGYEFGILVESPRQEFSAAYRDRLSRLPGKKAKAEILEEFSSDLSHPYRILLAGSAGERVQSAASLFITSAAKAGLYATQKNDNPVTQGFGFSLSEIILNPVEVFYTGISSPDALIILSRDGLEEVEQRGDFSRVSPSCVILVDSSLPLPITSHLPGKVIRYPFRNKFSPQNAAIGALNHLLTLTKLFPTEAFQKTVREFYQVGREKEIELAFYDYSVEFSSPDL